MFTINQGLNLPSCFCKLLHFLYGAILWGAELRSNGVKWLAWFWLRGFFETFGWIGHFHCLQEVHLTMFCVQWETLLLSSNKILLHYGETSLISIGTIKTYESVPKKQKSQFFINQKSMWYFRTTDVFRRWSQNTCKCSSTSFRSYFFCLWIKPFHWRLLLQTILMAWTKSINFALKQI